LKERYRKGYKLRRDEEEDVSSYWMTSGKRDDRNQRESTRSHAVKNPL